MAPAPGETILDWALACWALFAGLVFFFPRELSFGVYIYVIVLVLSAALTALGFARRMSGRRQDTRE